MAVLRHVPAAVLKGAWVNQWSHACNSIRLSLSGACVLPLFLIGKFYRYFRRKNAAFLCFFTQKAIAWNSAAMNTSQKIGGLVLTGKRNSVILNFLVLRPVNEANSKPEKGGAADTRS